MFETNSSSMHSLTIRKGKTNSSNLHIGNDNKVEIDFGEFGWEISNYPDQYSKLQYILTMCACTEGYNCITPDEFYETEGFKSISNAIASHCNCDGIRIKATKIILILMDILIINHVKIIYLLQIF